METISLARPLLVNGKELTELPYDTGAVSVDSFIKAESLAKSKSEGFAFSAAENDYAFHLELGFAAIIAADPHIDIADLDRIAGPDLVAVMRVGRNFIGDSSESQGGGSSESPDGTSGGQPESTPTSTARASSK